MPDLARPALNFGGELDPAIRRQVKTPAGGDLPQETIGECLCRERQRNGKTLIDISLELKIAPHHLIAIENDSFGTLPGRAYAIGFVRSYAAFLGLDAEKLVTRLKAEMAGRDVKPPTARPSAPLVRKDQVNAPRVEVGNPREPEIALFPAVAERAAPPLSPRERSAPILSSAERSIPVPSPAERSASMWSLPQLPVRQWFVPGLMLVLVIYFGYSVIASGLRVAPPPVIPVPDHLAAEAGLTPTKMQAPMAAPAQQSPHLSRNRALAPNTDAPPPVANIEKSAPISREPALAPSRSYALPRAATFEELAPVAREPALYPSGQAAPAQSDSAIAQLKPVFHPPLPLGQRYGEQNSNSRVTLRVHRPTRVAVLGTRNHIFINRVLRAGDTYRVPNMRGLKLNAADGGAIEVILDDNTVGFAGEDGVAARALSLQPQSIIARYHRPQD